MILHAIGDCHADYPWMYIDPSDTQFEHVWSNGIHLTMTHFGINKLNSCNISTSYYRGSPIPSKKDSRWVNEYAYQQYFNINNGDSVVFCFGEIDCRLLFSRDEILNTWKDVVDSVIPKYFEAIKSNIDYFDCVCTMVKSIDPPAKDIDIIQYPKEGTQEHRKDVILYVNNKIKEYCETYDYMFFDTYDKYCGNDGYMNMDFCDGSNHLFDPVYYIDFLNNINFS